VLSIIIFTIVVTLNGTIVGGHMGNVLDIAGIYVYVYIYLLYEPQNTLYNIIICFSCLLGTIFGMANTLASTAGVLSSYLVGKLTNNNGGII